MKLNNILNESLTTNNDAFVERIMDLVNGIRVPTYEPNHDLIKFASTGMNPDFEYRKKMYQHALKNLIAEFGDPSHHSELVATGGATDISVRDRAIYGQYVWKVGKRVVSLWPYFNTDSNSIITIEHDV